MEDSGCELAPEKFVKARGRLRSTLTGRASTLWTKLMEKINLGLRDHMGFVMSSPIEIIVLQRNGTSGHATVSPSASSSVYSSLSTLLVLSLLLDLFALFARAIFPSRLAHIVTF